MVRTLRSAAVAALRLHVGRVIWLLVVWLGASAAASAQDELPPGPNQDLVAHTCGLCHGLGQVLDGQGATRADWSSIIQEMISYGADIAPDDQAKILDYLSSTLGPDSDAAAPRPGG
jgi:mono/diheme cytochrome c family protein